MGRLTTATHWGAYTISRKADRSLDIHPIAEEHEPAAMGPALMDILASPSRIRRPAVRKDWLEWKEGGCGSDAGPGLRGRGPFVELPWDEALDLAASELERVKSTFGNTSIYGGSYGWASSGRLHHAQGQMRRFLNLIGGCTRSVNAYSYAAAEVILPRVIASLDYVTAKGTTWPTIAEHGELVVAFGGLPLKNAQVNSGGVAVHSAAYWMKKAHENGVKFVNIGPLREDVPDFVSPEWLGIRPNTDTAMMLAIAHRLIEKGRVDRAFLESHCTGYETLEAYILGKADGEAKTPEWAAEICGIPSSAIVSLADRMASSRTLVSVSWSLQRADHGEQPYWMAVALSAMLGQIGVPGCGPAFGINAMHGVGNGNRQVKWAAVNQGINPTGKAIPVARITDMLMNPGGEYTYDGRIERYPDTRLVYWVGGNPFHHHQDLNRLVKAWQAPETVIVHDIFWTPVAKYADIVFPATSALERNDIAAGTLDGYAVAMKKVADAPGEARDDREIFRALSQRFGVEEKFTEGRGEMEWLRHLYDVSRQRFAGEGLELPDFETFWEEGVLNLTDEPEQRTLLDDFRADPSAHRLRTPSGKIEISSRTIEELGLSDCRGHPAWMEPYEWLGSDKVSRFPLHLVSNQPKTRLHSQLDCARVSRASKIADREAIFLNPSDAAARGVGEGDIARVFNDRGACLAGVVVSDAVMQGVAVLPTGAWFDLSEPGVPGALEKHGNPNVLTRDKGTSGLAQGPSAHSCLVEVELFEGVVPAVTAFDPPALIARD